MNLAELAFACYIYSHMSDYDSSYRRLMKETSPQLDLLLEQHRLALLKWLNAWGCRQFAKDYHWLASKEIEEWYKGIGNQLFPVDKTLLTLADHEFALVEQAYAGLVDRTASKRTRNGRETRVEIGPTGVAKILFALRPNALIPWDDPIRGELGLDGSARSYCTYLRVVEDYLDELKHDCERQGFGLADLPQMLGRSESSAAKLIDEFFWVTISRGCPPPTESELNRWVTWQ